jgi:hypothetical protein
LAANVATAPVQLGALHCDVGYAHAVRPTPLHVPPQVVPVPLHAVRLPWGAPLTAKQVPTLFVTSHASHCPLHATSQQTPSTQYPLVHSSEAPHVIPIAFFARHTPTEQK